MYFLNKDKQLSENSDFFNDPVFFMELLDSLNIGLIIVNKKANEITCINKKAYEIFHKFHIDLYNELLSQDGIFSYLIDLKEPEFTIPGIDNKLMHLTKTVSSVYRNETEYLIECFAENSENFELVKQLEKTNRNLSNELNLLKQDQKELEHFAYHDYLTGLPNKFMLMKLLEHSIQIAKRSGKLIAVLFLDLDNFKIVNDSMGHSFGDQLLIQISKRLCENLREGDVISRIGGDEFLIILENLDFQNENIAVYDKIIDCFRTSFIVDDHQISITSSIGVSIFPDDGDTVKALIDKADISMYNAKEQGKNRWFRINLMKSSQVEKTHPID